MKRCICFLLLIMFAVLPSQAQHADTLFRKPFDFELFLSGNFGELRSNHFHSGLDFKTQGVVGKPIKCVADGYIKRASVTPGGYGMALYVMHDNGYMTVYGHLDRFPQGVAERVRDAQYGKECFSVDISFAPDEFRVRRGEVLAIAGNSGYSFGPHLHFELRDSTGEELYDPIPFFINELKDNRLPVVSKVAIYPSQGAGAVDSGYVSKVYALKSGTLCDTVEVWGRIGFGIKAIDYMTGTNNKYGVRNIELLVDDSLRFSSAMDRFSFKENRLINAWADYSRYVNDGEWFQRLFLLENNPLRALWADANKGWIDVNEERLYKVECRLGDYHGNISNLLFHVRGKEQKIQPPAGAYNLYWFLNNSVEHNGMSLYIPAGELFESVTVDIAKNDGEYGISGRYSFGESPLPLWHSARLGLRVDTLAVDSSKLYIRQVTKKGGFSVGGKYSDGWLYADVGSLGCFEVAVDTVSPSIVPVSEKNWSRSGKVVFAVSDKQTSVRSFRGTLNGNFVLFKYSSKNGRIELDCRKENIRAGKHLLRLEVTDACGNSAVFEKRLFIK